MKGNPEMSVSPDQQHRKPIAEGVLVRSKLLHEYESRLMLDGYELKAMHPIVGERLYVRYELPDGKDPIVIIMCAGGCHVELLTPVDYSGFRPEET
jgi:hypothetical protein